MAREHQHPADVDARIAHFTQWRGRISLLAGLLLGPIVVLLNQVLIYASNMWVCGHGMSTSLHIIPVLSLVVAVGAGVAAHRNWVALGRGIHDTEATVAERSRFLALLGMGTSALSALLIAAMWLAIFLFGSCMRA